MKMATSNHATRVSEVMRKPVVQLPEYLTMFEAAKLFLGHGISGAPVVDDHGRCLGVLSAFDFVRWQCIENDAECFPVGTETFSSRNDLGTSFRTEHIDRECVTAYMTRAAHTILEDATLTEASRMMTLMHVHRLPVLDRCGHPIGWISSLDLLAQFGPRDEAGQSGA